MSSKLRGCVKLVTRVRTAYRTTFLVVGIVIVLAMIKIGGVATMNQPRLEGIGNGDTKWFREAQRQDACVT